LKTCKYAYFQDLGNTCTYIVERPEADYYRGVWEGGSLEKKSGVIRV